jgi:hypothetical protein
VPQLIGIALVPRENATALSSSRTHGSSGKKDTDIQGTCSPPDARLAETNMVPAGHGHNHQGALPAACPGRSLDRNTTTESVLVCPAPRSEPASRRPPVPADPALTLFPSDGRDTRRRRHPSDLIWANAVESTERVVYGMQQQRSCLITFWDYANRPSCHSQRARRTLRTQRQRKVLVKAFSTRWRRRTRTRGQELRTDHSALTGLQHEYA